jgi:hypothetical protein
MSTKRLPQREKEDNRSYLSGRGQTACVVGLASVILLIFREYRKSVLEKHKKQSEILKAEKTRKSMSSVATSVVSIRDPVLDERVRNASSIIVKHHPETTNDDDTDINENCEGLDNTTGEREWEILEQTSSVQHAASAKNESNNNNKPLSLQDCVDNALTLINSGKFTLCDLVRLDKLLETFAAEEGTTKEDLQHRLTAEIYPKLSRWKIPGLMMLYTEFNANGKSCKHGGVNCPTTI